MFEVRHVALAHAAVRDYENLLDILDCPLP